MRCGEARQPGRGRAATRLVAQRLQAPRAHGRPAGRRARGRWRAKIRRSMLRAGDRCRRDVDAAARAVGLAERRRRIATAWPSRGRGRAGPHRVTSLAAVADVGLEAAARPARRAAATSPNSVPVARCCDQASPASSRSWASAGSRVAPGWPPAIASTIRSRAIVDALAAPASRRRGDLGVLLGDDDVDGRPTRTTRQRLLGLHLDAARSAAAIVRVATSGSQHGARPGSARRVWKAAIAHRAAARSPCAEASSASACSSRAQHRLGVRRRSARARVGAAARRGRPARAAATLGLALQLRRAAATPPTACRSSASATGGDRPAHAQLAEQAQPTEVKHVAAAYRVASRRSTCSHACGAAHCAA